MAVVVRMDWSGVGREEYDRVIAALGYKDGQGEPGGIYHTAVVEGGVNVVDVWESADSIGRFVEQRLMPALVSAQVPPPGGQEALQSHSVVIPPDGLVNAPAGALRMIFDVPGLGAENYDAIIRDLDAAGLSNPAGRLFHVAAPTERGWFVMDIWESEETLNAFVPDLMPIIAKQGVPMDPPPARVEPLYNTLRAPTKPAGRSLMAFAAPVLPGKEEQAHAFFAAIGGDRRADITASRRRLGLRERSFRMTTPNGELVIVTVEGADPMKGFGEIAQADDEFTNWFVQQVQDIHGFNLREPLPGEPPCLIVDTGDPAEENKATVRRFLDGVLNGHNVSVLDEVVGEGYRNYMPIGPDPLDTDAAKDAIGQFLTAFPDMHAEAEAILAEGDLVTVVQTITGTQHGPLLNAPATGRPVHLKITSTYRMRDGKIVEDYPGFHPVQLLQQLGLEAAAVR